MSESAPQPFKPALGEKGDDFYINPDKNQPPVEVEEDFEPDKFEEDFGEASPEAQTATAFAVAGEPEQLAQAGREKIAQNPEKRDRVTGLLKRHALATAVALLGVMGMQGTAEAGQRHQGRHREGLNARTVVSVLSRGTADALREWSYERRLDARGAEQAVADMKNDERALLRQLQNMRQDLATIDQNIAQLDAAGDATGVRHQMAIRATIREQARVLGQRIVALDDQAQMAQVHADQERKGARKLRAGGVLADVLARALDQGRGHR